MESALKLGHLDADIIRGESFVSAGDVSVGIKILLNTLVKIREYESKCKDGESFEAFNEVFKKCIDLLSKAGHKFSSNSNRPITQQPGRYLVNPDQLVMPPDNDVFLGDIVGMQDAKLALVQAVLLPNVVKDALPIEFRWRGIILFGPSGVGKSKVVRALVNSISKTTDIKITFLNVTLDQVCGSYYGDTEKNMAAIFKAAESKSPSILLYDEIDSLCTSRENHRRHGELNITNHFLSILDGLKPNANIVVIGTTNKIYSIDNAFYRRFQRMIYVELPNQELREKMLRKFVGRLQPTRYSFDIDFKTLAEDTASFSPADLQMLVSLAAQEVRCSKIGREVLSSMELNQDVVCEKFKDYEELQTSIQHADLLWARRRTRPTNSSAEISKLENFASSNCEIHCDWNGFEGSVPDDCDCCTKEDCLESPMMATFKGIHTCLSFVFGEFI